jgi:cellulose synthase/poly-beta-1,6-N-acetylglucosamine synthase-like glycosyltransferase
VNILVYITAIVYVLCLGLIFLYTVLQFQLLYFYWRYASTPLSQTDLPEDEAQWPLVTIQLPVYNERYVVERLLDAVAAFDYPKQRFDIQVLDDSTDETTALIEAKIPKLQALGINISHVRRGSREGFKAGALKYGMEHSSAEFIAIFDADFIPQPDFLRHNLKFFTEQTALVQTRWGHLNQDYSLLTRLQALHLDVHFAVEQKGRNAGACFAQFNGTAGIWRRAAIEAAGGWHADTLTEDLDLSYRAQLKGWQVVYNEDYVCMAELPAEIGGLKSQQFRWTKGAAENARKLLPSIWASQLNMRQKLHASAHLLGSTVFIIVLLLSICGAVLHWNRMLFVSYNLSWLSFMYSSFIMLSIIYATVYVFKRNQNQPIVLRIFSFLGLYPLFLALSIGLSLHNSIAVFEGWRGKKSPFIRTPKYNIARKEDKLQQNNYFKSKLDKTSLLEAGLFVAFAITSVHAFWVHDTFYAVFSCINTLGFGTIFAYTLFHRS